MGKMFTIGDNETITEEMALREVRIAKDLIRDALHYDIHIEQLFKRILLQHGFEKLVEETDGIY